jgi:hypothetical protein
VVVIVNDVEVEDDVGDDAASSTSSEGARYAIPIFKPIKYFRKMSF